MFLCFVYLIAKLSIDVFETDFVCIVSFNIAIDEHLCIMLNYEIL